MQINEMSIWFDKPGDIEKWEQECLPVGNGFMGASVFGGIVTERIVLNEKTLWTGGPSPLRPDYNGGNKTGRLEFVRQVQELLAEGKYDEAKALLPELTGLTDGYGAYQLLCDIRIDFPQLDEAGTTEYKRRLDLSTATAEVEFVHGGITYTRQIFASYPDRVIVIKLAASKKGKLTFRFSLEKVQQGFKCVSERDELICFGALKDNGLRSYTKVKFLNKGGKVRPAGDAMSVLNAEEVVIILSSATDYENRYPHYRSGLNPERIVAPLIENAELWGFDKLLSRHVEDYTALFGRVKLDMGKPILDMPMERLLRLYQGGDKDITRQIDTLMFQFGRYVLIASSREGSLPANLQGVWNESNTPPWNCDYHINVNLQMNYWGAYSGNLAELAKPLVNYINALRKPGRITAAEYYGIISDEKNPENGWAAHTQCNPYGWTSPGWDFYWGWSTAAVAWLMQNIWEHFEFSGDEFYLEEKIYPIMLETAKFYKQWLIYDEKQDRMVSSPTYSPEHGPVTVGNTYEQSLIQQSFIDLVKAAEALHKTRDPFIAEIKELIPKLKPFKIGKDGRLLEWFEEEDEGFDKSQVEDKHRHISHLMGLYPGKTIDTPELLEAARKTLDDRGDNSTGWARAYKQCLWARLGDGNRAHKLLYGLITESTYPNLFGFHPPFQLDSNFGASAGIAEMLLQSHKGFIEPLPAVPDYWSDGEFSGLCARGGFEVSVKWRGGKPYEIQVLSTCGNICRVKTDLLLVQENGVKVLASYVDGIFEFRTKADCVYTIV